MAATLRKLADKLEGKDKEPNNPNSSNFGPHSTAAANKVDPTIDSDRDGRNDPTSRVGGYGNTQTTHGHVGGQTHAGTGIGHTQTSTIGPHDSNLANKLDPRVDSDQSQHVGGYGNTHTTHGHVGGQTHTGAGLGHTQPSTTTGPHNSNLANKLDPRVDSDQSQHVGGGYGTHQTTSTHTTHSSGINPVAGNHSHSTNTGPHNSNVANKLDPRVDSDPTSHAGGYGTTHTGTGGYTGTNPSVNNPNSANVGPHSSNLFNKLDPRVDSDVDGRNNPTSHVGGYGQTHQTSHIGGTTHGTHAGAHTTTGTQGYTGTNVAHDDPRSTNTGPHSSNLLNKLDPRVDSDRDGRNDPTSRTGGYGQTQTGNSGIGRY